MRKIAIVLFGCSLLAQSACAGMVFRTSATGFLYANATGPYEVTQNKLGSKSGEACASSILGLITTGDASTATAAKAGSINSISAVDSKFTNVLGLYSSMCTRVSGD